MNERTASRLAWSLWATTAGIFFVSFVIGAFGHHAAVSTSPTWARVAPTVTTVLWVFSFATVGALVASRRPSNPVGWLFAASGLCYALGAVAEFLKHLTPGIERWPLGWIWALGLFLTTTFGLLLFPTGTLLSRRWRPVSWAAGVGIFTFVLGSTFAPGVSSDTGKVNPLGVHGPLGSVFKVLPAGIVLAIVATLVAIVSVGIRFHRAETLEREQLKWLIFAGAMLILALIGQVIIGKTVANPDMATDLENSLISLAVALVPLAAGIAILKYRLYDIDVVINKALVYASLAAFITAVYVGIVVGIGTAIGRGDHPNLALSILATAVVAVAFQPVRERVQRFANRLVYGKRATPYETLSEFSRRMAGTYAADDVLPRMARILGEGTGAKEARVWLASPGGLVPAAVWPDSGANGSPARPDGADLLVPVTHQGDELGALSISKQAGERLTPAEEKLTTDLASQAGLVLRNVKLIEDLKASRVRLVQAQDSERRKIERNIHDGAQQQLVALNVKLGLARHLLADPDRITALHAELQTETNQALQDLRDLARGIYPPLLADQGLTAALESQARKSAIPVTVTSDTIGRYPQDVEAAVYFCTLEALQNVAKYAGATIATVTLSAADGHLTFTVTDDGAGFDTSTTSYGSGLQGMADRLSALGGQIEVRGTLGVGTTVAGSLPVANDRHHTVGGEPAEILA